MSYLYSLHLCQWNFSSLSPVDVGQKPYHVNLWCSILGVIVSIFLPSFYVPIFLFGDLSQTHNIFTINIVWECLYNTSVLHSPQLLIRVIVVLILFCCILCTLLCQWQMLALTPTVHKCHFLENVAKRTTFSLFVCY